LGMSRSGGKGGGPTQKGALFEKEGLEGLILDLDPPWDKIIGNREKETNWFDCK